jgi:hypothetical protein
MDDAETYRERARQCRRLDGRQSRERRRYIRSLADGFDKMADARGSSSRRRRIRKAGDGIVWRALVGIAVGLMIGIAVAE